VAEDISKFDRICLDGQEIADDDLFDEMVIEGVVPLGESTERSTSTTGFS
jgi:hypothetical protein